MKMTETRKRMPRRTTIHEEPRPASNKVIAILGGDLHASKKPPPARAGEPCWFRAQGRVLHEIGKLQSKYAAPLILPGDIFDHWDATTEDSKNPGRGESTETINFLLNNLSGIIYAVPGNHDLPYHSLNDIKKSAYWTLVEAGRIKHLSPNSPEPTDDLILEGFPHGCELTPGCQEESTFPLRLAVVHQYVWNRECSYPNAPVDGRVSVFRKKLKNFDACVVGEPTSDPSRISHLRMATGGLQRALHAISHP